MYFRILIASMFSIMLGTDIDSKKEAILNQFNTNMEGMRESSTKELLYKNILLVNERIHELEKEKYMLKAEIQEKQIQDLILIRLNEKSGIFASLGMIFSNAEGSISSYGAINVGYVKFYKNDVGIRFSAFYAYNNDYAFGYDFALMKDFRIYKNNYFGILMGADIFLRNDKQLYARVNFGINFTISNHHRIEFTRSAIFHQGSVNLLYSYMF